MENDVAVREVLEAEHEWTRAHLELDIDALERLMAEDYVQVTDKGQLIRKEEALASYRSMTRAWETAQSDEHVVQVYGDVAVVIGRWRARGQHGDELFDYESRFISVYVKRDGRWQMVTDQSTRIGSG